MKTDGPLRGLLWPNFHGSKGFGLKFMDAIKGQWGGAPYEDQMKGRLPSPKMRAHRPARTEIAVRKGRFPIMTPGRTLHLP